MAFTALEGVFFETASFMNANRALMSIHRTLSPLPQILCLPRKHRPTDIQTLRQSFALLSRSRLDAVAEG